jgi:Ca-activated chloride channel homolog
MEIHGIHFANPGWLLAILFLPLAVVAFFFAARAKRSILSVGNPRLVEGASGLFRAQALPWTLRFLVLALCLLAAARPQNGEKRTEEKKPATDIFVALDVSDSMHQNDLKPDRLTAAKEVLANFLNQVKDARIGLVVFAGAAFTQCPMTRDVPLLKSLLGNVEIGSVRVSGTAIGDALLACLNRLEKGSEATESEAAKTSIFSRWFQREKKESPVSNYQAVVLLTDGVSNAGQVDLFTAAKIAAAKGVKIYSIGVGGLEGPPALYRMPDGQLTYKAWNGKLVREQGVDMKSLKEISRLTGGRAYLASDNRALGAVLGEIAKLEKRDAVVVTQWTYEELAPLFLAAAFFLLAFDMALGMTVLRTLP